MKVFPIVCVSVLTVPLLLATACKGEPTGATETTGAPLPADNTKINERDRVPTTSVTPMDQGSSAADTATTQQIRKALMADDTLSSNAKNAKIITANGVVTLRGPVQSDVERQNIEGKARALAGSNRVDDQLDLEAAK